MRAWMFGLLLAVGASIAVAGLIVLTVTSNETTIVELEPGECFVLPVDGDTEIGEIDVIDCDEPHNAEVVGVGELNPEGDREYPDDEALFAEVDQRCAGLLGEAAAEFGLVPVAPNEASWEPLAGRYVCVAMPFGGGTVTGSLGIVQRA